MKTFFRDRQAILNLFARLAAMFGSHYGILYECSFTKPLTLLRGVIFDKVNVMKTFFFDMQSWDVFARLAAIFGIHCGILHE